jgi:hypothetical protein
MTILMTMKRILTPFAVVLFLITTACQPNTNHANHDHGQDHDHTADSSMHMSSPEAIPDSIPGSPRVAAMANIGNAHVHIDYSTPAVRGRIVWGGLVPFNTVWVTGAHDATSITSPVDIVIQGQQIPAGKYAFFTIPGETEWTLILNKNWDQHLTRKYDQTDDVLRWTVTPTAVEHTERLRYDIMSISESIGRITMSWEKIQIGFEFSI